LRTKQTQIQKKQNEFCAEGGKLHDAVKGVMESTNMLANSIQVVDAARAKGCKVSAALCDRGWGWKGIEREGGSKRRSERDAETDCHL